MIAKKVIRGYLIKKGFITSLMCCLFLLSTLPAMVNAQPDQIDNKVEAAISTEDWEKVANLLEAINPQSSSPVERLIKGQADLALNRNNESLCLFLSISENDLKAWDEWTQGFVKGNSKSAVSYYLRGDALARLEKWDEAINAFNNALEINPKHAMVLNARGVSYAAKQQWDESLLDLTKASMLDRKFADAYASLGAMWIQSRTGVNGALQAFDQAIELSPHFGLAYNGKGCAEYALGHWEDANKNIGIGGKGLNCQNTIPSIIPYNLNIIAISAKRFVFPVFSQIDFINWNEIKKILRDPDSIFYEYFQSISLPEEVNDLVIAKFNEILEIPQFYEKHKSQINMSQDSNASKNELIEHIKETEPLRNRTFDTLNENEKGKIRKLNRLLVEYLFPKDIMQLAMNQIDAPGFSLERGVSGFVDSWNFKNTLANQKLQDGLFRMQNTYRPMADTLSKIPIIGGVGEMWNKHLDNQIGINKDILRSRGIDTHSGGVDFSMRKAYIDKGDWGVGTWFGLAYHVETVNSSSLKIGNK